MRVLFVCAGPPARRHLRPYGFLRALARGGHRATVVCGAGPGDARGLADLRARGVRVVAVPLGPAERRRNMLRAAPGPLPGAAAAAFSEALANAVRAEARSGAYDVAHVDGLPASALGHALAGLPAVLDAARSASLALARRSRAGWPAGALAALDLGRTRRHEGAYLASYDRVFCASAEDAWALSTLAAGAGIREPAIHVIPTPVDAGREADLLALRDQGALLLCAGADGRADEALAALAGEMMPAIWRQRADIRLLVAGALPRRLARAAADPRILRVDADDWRALSQATLALADGAEAADHALLAMSLGTPLVAGPAAARALRASHGRELLRAEGPGGYARAALELLDDPRYRGQLGRAGRAYVERHHGLSAAAYELEQIYGAACGADNADWRLDMGLGRLLSRQVGGEP